MMRTVSVKMKWALAAVLSVVVVLMAGTAAYAVHFADRGLPGVSVVGMSVTGKTQDEVVQEIATRAADLTVTVTIDGQTTTAKLSELGVTVDADATAAKAFADNASVGSRVGALFSHSDVPIEMSLDEPTLETFATSLSAKVGTPATDATVGLSQDASTFVATDSQPGVGVDVSQLTSIVSKAAESLTSQAVDLQTSEITPKVTTEQAQTAADEANKLIATDLTVGGDVTTHVATAAQKASWVDIPTTDSGLGDPSFDAAKVTEWVTSTGEQTNDKPVDAIKNVNSRGDVVSTPSEGKAGWTVNNADTIASEAVAALQSGQSYTGHFTYDKVEPEVATRTIADGAENLAYQAAPGEKWIDINLSAHTVSAYEGATIVRGPVSMVNGAPETPTVTGTFKVYLKYDSQTMRGENADGTNYVTEGVPWISYFTGGYALHGAPWRSSFGFAGSGGSHGCVNMPVSEAKWFYDWDEVGTIVVSHN